MNSKLWVQKKRHLFSLEPYTCTIPLKTWASSSPEFFKCENKSELLFGNFNTIWSWRQQSFYTHTHTPQNGAAPGDTYFVKGNKTSCHQLVRKTCSTTLHSILLVHIPFFCIEVAALVIVVHVSWLLGFGLYLEGLALGSLALPWSWLAPWSRKWNTQLHAHTLWRRLGEGTEDQKCWWSQLEWMFSNWPVVGAQLKKIWFSA